MNPLASLSFFYPELVILIGAFAALLLDFLVKEKKLIGYFALGVLLVAVFCTRLPHPQQGLFFGLFQLNSFMHFFRYAVLGIIAVTLLLSIAYRPLRENQGEYYSLFLFMAFGLILMAASTNLLMIFLGIEFVSILSYILVGYQKQDPRGKEAALKYLLFGSAASGLMLFGMSLLFGATGSLELTLVQKGLTASTALRPVALTGTLLFLAGIGFKISMAPFHFWAPDVYEGAPTPVTAFLTVGPKALGFAVLIRVLLMAYPVFELRWGLIITLLAIATMTIGNITAIAQNNIKRLLAYSSIAQAGYILMGAAAVSKIGMIAILVYILAYALTNLGAFAIVTLASNHFGNDDVESYAGLSRRNPLLAGALTVFFLSLAGLPPFAGFIGKYYVFSAAISSGLITLAIAAVLNSAVAAYYYFKVVRIMYLVPAAEQEAIPQPAPLLTALLVMLAGTILMGILPAPVINFIQTSLFV